ncbi:ABC transporter ATP-binding protein [Amnibacterium setariae]|uniref:ABC-type quaternary amine transporter n=1 Tax=Amnibacterium setariae TaxID=2306585 RepID=A0A3A1U0Q6_9MICO|nr:ABC transporter ATP-binding protein [Amnibacterium setariae]RIX28036.1 ABC transporter ATP-binding protein [Amnibacterium setariae]
MTTTVPTPADSLVVRGTPVELVDVVKDYGSGARALDGISLDIRPGEFVALLGPSGCGKTTALRAISGLETIDAGHVRIGGRQIESVPVHKRDIGMVFQSYSLFPHMTVTQNTAFGLQMRKVGRAERDRRVQEALDLVGLGHLGERYAHQLSGGQQQRVALARALVTRPRVLLLDEPLSALDAKVRVQLRDEIRRIQQETGITAVFVTHDQEEALAVADRVAVMNAGSIEQIGTPEDLYLRPATEFVAGFVGHSNRVEGVLEHGRVQVAGQELPALPGATPDGPVVAFVRPEDVHLAADGLPGIVVSTSFLGAARRTVVRLETGIALTVQHAAAEHPETGDLVRVAFAGQPVAVAARS